MNPMDHAYRLAGQQLGMNEREQNAALQEYMRNGGVNLDPAVTAWCAGYVNATLEQAGIQGTNSLAARSFMDWGVSVDQPQRGDLAVFSRGDPSGWQGHVGFFDGYGDDGRIRVLGGNQGDAVSLAYYDPSRLLGFRRAGEGSGAPADPSQAYAPQIAQQAATGPQNALQPQTRQEQMMNTLAMRERMVPGQQQQDPSAYMTQFNALAPPEFRPRYLTRA